MKELPNVYGPAYQLIVDAVETARYDTENYEMVDVLDYIRDCAQGKDVVMAKCDKDEAHKIIERFLEGAKYAGWSLPWTSADEVMAEAEPQIIKALSNAYNSAVMNYSHPITSLSKEEAKIEGSSDDLHHILEYMRASGKQLEREEHLTAPMDVSYYIATLLRFYMYCDEAGLTPSFE